MPKIELPAKRNINGKLDYVFDDLAAAIIKADEGPFNVETDYDLVRKIITYKATIMRVGPFARGRGPTPTAALLAAILKFNEGG